MAKRERESSPIKVQVVDVVNDVDEHTFVTQIVKTIRLINDPMEDKYMGLN